MKSITTAVPISADIVFRRIRESRMIPWLRRMMRRNTRGNFSLSLGNVEQRNGHHSAVRRQESEPGYD
jgi:hypothetical protein